MNLDLLALAAEFAKAEELGVKLDAFIAGWVERHPEFAPDAEKLRALLADEVQAAKIMALAAGSLAGALHAFLAGHGEQGKHTAHMA